MNKQLALATAPIGDSVDRYMLGIREIPVLDAGEERALAIRLREHNDLDAARQLVLSNLRFVAHVARGYSGYGLPMADLIQEGNVGLMKAVKRFDPGVGVRLISFAVHWIRAEIHEYILRNWRIVKVATTKAQRKLFFNLRGAKKRLGWLNREEVDAVATDLGVKPETVMEMEARLSSHDVAFDMPVDESAEQPVVAPAGYLEDNRFDPARQIEGADQYQHQTRELSLALDALDERSRSIVEQRWLAESKATLHELADQYGVSAERIRQIEAAAMKKLRARIAA